MSCKISVEIEKYMKKLKRGIKRSIKKYAAFDIDITGHVLIQLCYALATVYPIHIRNKTLRAVP